ncbi:MAG: DnaB-like helicase C-terminal domain-containing protein, partial [Pseudoflavonifractor sp.]
DYLQLIPSPGHNRTEDVTRISLGLHQMAQGNAITVVALSQLSRPETGKDGKKAAPTMASLRESGQIEQDADVVMLLYEEEPGSRTRVLKIAKNKEGERGKLLLDFDGARQTFRPAEDESKTVAAQYSAIGKKIKQQENAKMLAQQVEIDEDPWKDEKK